MIAGGALGNVLDRVRHGSVTDFIKLPLGWPPFNLADTSITVGILILFVVIDRTRQGERAHGHPMITDAPTQPVHLHDRLPGRVRYSSWTRAPAPSFIPRGGIARARSAAAPQLAGRRGGEDPERPGIVTGSTATPRVCSSSRARGGARA